VEIAPSTINGFFLLVFDVIVTIFANAVLVACFYKREITDIREIRKKTIYNQFMIESQM
jgi:hypothetical protein